MHITIDEGELYSLFLVLLAGLALLSVLRLAALLLRKVALPVVVEVALLLTGLAAPFVVMTTTVDLTCALLVLGVAASFLVAPTPRAMYGSAVLAFCVLAAIAPACLSSAAEMLVHSSSTPWSSSYHGQRAILLPPTAELSSTVVRRLHIFHDAVQMRGVPQERWTDLQPDGLSLLVSIGSNTVLDYVGAGHDVGHRHFDEVVLLGSESVVRHAHFRCRASLNTSRSSGEVVDAHESCLGFRSDVVLHNTTISIISAEAPAVRIFMGEAKSCGDLFHAVAQTSVATPADVVRCYEVGQGDSPAPILAQRGCWVEVARQMPLPLFIQSSLPGQVRRAKIIVQESVLPAVVVVVGGAIDATMWLGSAVVNACLPAGMWALAELSGVFAGITCGRDPTQLLMLSAEAVCQYGGTRHSGPLDAYLLGVQVRSGLTAATSAVGAVLDLFPGLWAVLRWAWRAEERITGWCVVAMWDAMVLLVICFRFPCATLLSGFMHVAHRLPLYREYVAEAVWRAEGVVGSSQLVGWAMSLTGRAMQQLMDVVMRVVASSWSLGNVLLSAHRSQPFSVQLCVIAIQTLILVVAMRNELMTWNEESRSRLAQRERGVMTGLMSRVFGPAEGRLSRWASASTRYVRFFVAHHDSGMTYVMDHSVMVLILLGLSILPFSGKLHVLVLHVVLPWRSSRAFLRFFVVEDEPRKLLILLVVVAKSMMGWVLQHTAGDILYALLRDACVGGCILVCFGAVMMWQRRSAQQSS